MRKVALLSELDQATISWAWQAWHRRLGLLKSRCEIKQYCAKSVRILVDFSFAKVGCISHTIQRAQRVWDP
eukprot:1418252-Amphidinium_carterae.1